MSWLSNTLGSVAGSVLGSAVQNHYNSANAAQANEWNVENYKHRYQWAVEDMRKAGLNPILAATNGIGGSISGASAASVGMSDIGSTMNSAKAASAAERQAKNAEHLAISQIDKNVAEADSVRHHLLGKRCCGKTAFFPVSPDIQLECPFALQVHPLALGKHRARKKHGPHPCTHSFLYHVFLMV